MLAIFAIGCADEALLTILDGGSDPVITAPPDEIWEAIQTMRIERNIDLTAQKAFYTKYIDAAGIAILANAGVADEHLIEARQIIISLTAKRPELREMLSTQGRENGSSFYMILVDTLNYLPEFGDLYLAGRGSCTGKGSPQSGFIGFCYAPVNLPQKHGGDPDLPGITQTVHPLHIFVHEFGHAIHAVIQKLDQDAYEQIEVAYAHQMGGSHLIQENEEREWWEVGSHCEQSHFEGLQVNPATWLTGLYQYGRANCREYFAEAIRLWAHDIGTGKKIKSHDAFAKRDPLLSEILEEWLPRIPARE